MLSAINLLHGNTKARVITPDRETEYFEIKASLLQGDKLGILPTCPCDGLHHTQNLRWKRGKDLVSTA